MCGKFILNRNSNYRNHRECREIINDDYFSDKVLRARNFVETGIDFFHSEILVGEKLDLPLPLRQLTVSQFEKMRDTPPNMRKMSDVFDISTQWIPSREYDHWIPNGLTQTTISRFNPNNQSR